MTTPKFDRLAITQAVLAEDVYIDKIPKKLRELFKNERLEDYKPNINPKIPLDEQKLQKKILINYNSFYKI